MKLVNELQGETNEAIIESRIAGLASELRVNPFQCALVYHIKHNETEFKKMFGADVRIRVRPT